MNYSLLLDLLQSGDYERLLRSRTYKQHVCRRIRAPLLRSHIRKQTIFINAEENTVQGGFLPQTILRDEKQYLQEEGILLVQGKYPRWSQKQSAAKRECVALGRDMYIQLRDIIVSLFYSSPKSYLTLDRLFHFVRSEHFAEASVVYSFLNRYGYINFGVSSSEEIAKPSGSHKPPSILIVGAGSAGLAASQQLCKFGFDVIVLEGRSRIGGRIKTLNLKTVNACPIDMGVSFSIGKEGNPLYLIAQQKDIPLIELPAEVPLFSCYGGVVHYLIESDVEKQFYKLLNSMAENQTSIINNNGGKDMPIRTALESLRNFAICAPTAGESENQEQVHHTFLSTLNWHEANLEYENAAPLEDLSFRCWEQEEDLRPSGPAWFPVSGFSSILGQLTSHLMVATPYSKRKSGTIYFETSVNSISCLGESVTIRSVGGSEFTADCALVTVPLGVLKERSIQFVPELPSWKQDAIDRLGVGLESKVILYFEEPFWPTHMPVFGNCVPDTARKGEHFLFLNLYEATKHPILVALTTGLAAREAEKQKDEVLVDTALATLKRMFGASRVTNPRYSIRSSWCSDPFARGTYSYLPVGASPNDFDVLARPLGNRIFFGGEAMSRQSPSTPAGAILSSLRNAGRISRMHSPTRTAFELHKKHEMAHLFVTLQTHFSAPGLKPPVCCFSVPPKGPETEGNRPSLSLKDLVRATTISEYRYLNPLVVAAVGGRRDEDTRRITLFKRDPTSPCPPPDEDDVQWNDERPNFSLSSPNDSARTKQLPEDWDTKPLSQQMLDCVEKELIHHNNPQNGITSRSIAHGLVEAFLLREMSEFGACDFSQANLSIGQQLQLQMLAANFASGGVLEPATLTQFPVTRRPPTQSLGD